MSADEIARILDELGNRLGPAGEYVFALAIRQIYIEAAAAAVMSGLLLWGARWLWVRAENASNIDSGPMRGISWAMVAVAVMWAALFVLPVLNPEYAAIKNLLDGIR